MSPDGATTNGSNLPRWADVDTVHRLAEIGVVLLVFAIGIEISFRELISLGKVIVFGGILQIAATAALLTPIGVFLGFDITTAIILGMVGALSSTMVVLKTLTDRGEIHSLHGRLLTGFLLMQDLVFILMIAMLPALDGSGSGASVLREIGLGVLKTVVIIGGVALLGIKVMPMVMSRITLLGSREVFVLMVVALVFAISGLTNFVGLSAALGAFVAGLLLSESDIGHWALAEVAPLRDVFAALFFASLGMLTDPVFIVDNLCQRAGGYRGGGGNQVHRHRYHRPYFGIPAQHRTADRSRTGPDWGVSALSSWPGRWPWAWWSSHSTR